MDKSVIWIVKITDIRTKPTYAVEKVKTLKHGK